MTYDIIEADSIYQEMLQADPEYDHKLVKHWRDNMPEQFAKRMYEDKYGKHIVDEDFYEIAVSYLKWGGRHGAKWTLDEIVALARINFDEKPYYEMDFAFTVNRLYADNCTIFNDASYFLKMAQAYLESKNYAGKSDERAYNDACALIKHYKKEDETAE